MILLECVEVFPDQLYFYGSHDSHGRPLLSARSQVSYHALMRGQILRTVAIGLVLGVVRSTHLFRALFFPIWARLVVLCTVYIRIRVRSVRFAKSRCRAVAALLRCVTKSAPLHAQRRWCAEPFWHPQASPWAVSDRGRPSSGFGLVFLLEEGTGVRRQCSAWQPSSGLRGDLRHGVLYHPPDLLPNLLLQFFRVR